MKTVYIDPVDFKCHTAQNVEDTLVPYATDFFDGKCDSFIEGYRFIPSGESWTRSDGEVFTGEMVCPWKDFSELDAAQREYERQRLADAENALAILLGGEMV